MKVYTIELKEVDMLCSKCVMRVLKVLTKMEAIKDLEVDLHNKSIKIVSNNPDITKDMIATVINNSIMGTVST